MNTAAPINTLGNQTQQLPQHTEVPAEAAQPFAMEARQQAVAAASKAAEPLAMAADLSTKQSVAVVINNQKFDFKPLAFGPLRRCWSYVSTMQNAVKACDNGLDQIFLQTDCAVKVFVEAMLTQYPSIARQKEFQPAAIMESMSYEDLQELIISMFDLFDISGLRRTAPALQPKGTAESPLDQIPT